MVRNSYDHLSNKLLTSWSHQKIRRVGLLHTNKKSIVHNLHLVIPGAVKNGALKTWAHVALDDKYCYHVISGLRNSSTSTTPAPPLSLFMERTRKPSTTHPIPTLPPPDIATVINPTGKGTGNTRKILPPQEAPSCQRRFYNVDDVVKTV